MSTTAIILAAGKGTRMKSDLPKVLHPVCGKPMLSYVIDACRNAGCDRLIIVVGHRHEMVREAFANLTGNVSYVMQVPQKGTGHAVMVCQDELESIEGPVLVVAGDGPLIRPHTLKELVQVHQQKKAACTLATSMLPDPAKYGRILRDAKGDLLGIVEYVDATATQRAIQEVNVSLYCFDAASLRNVLPRLNNNNNKGEYYLTDALGLLRADGKRLAAVAAVPPEDVMSINTPDELAEVGRIMAARDAKGAQR